jgi:hypothetical protein
MAKLNMLILKHTNMNQIIRKRRIVISAIIVCMAGFTGCNGDEIYEKEMYHPVLYLLSSGTDNVYTVVIPFKETDATVYFSAGCGGSRPNPEKVTVEFGLYTVLYDKYNRMNFDSEDSYARLLPSNRYEISSFRAVLPANSPEQYVKVPVKINHHGLSPDSVYFIPLAIKSVSQLEESDYNRYYTIISAEGKDMDDINLYYRFRT